MATRTQRVKNTVSTIPETLPESLHSPTAKLVYLYIVQQTRTTLDNICTALNLTKLTTYPILRKLVSKDLVEKNGDEYSYAGTPS